MKGYLFAFRKKLIYCLVTCLTLFRYDFNEDYPLEFE